MTSSSLMAIRRTDRFPRIPLYSTDSRHMPDVCPAASFTRHGTAFCGNGKDTAGSGNSQLVHLTFLRTDPVRRVRMRTDLCRKSCPVSHKGLLQRLQRTTRYTSLRVRPLHVLQRYGS